jgi:type IV pilus assembly protein PilM
MKSFLAADFGAGTLKLAEFEINEAGGLTLIQYGVRPLGAEGSQEAARESTVLKALQELLAQGGYTSKELNACAPGFHVFSKFVKLPPVDTSKVQQIIQYEAQQNVPFPLEEVVWDYQILGTSATGELEVLLVAIKTEVVEGLFKVAEGASLRMQLVDVSPAALCNAFRYNYGDLEGEGCTMLLDIGAKTSNLLFFEKGKVYSRSINIGANSITQDFATEAKLRFPEAEALKIEKGFVSLGGAYEEPDDPQAAAISKIARQVMTRLHIQVNQTIQFYRGQQGGSAPARLFLSGGASIMVYTAQFFAEKLNVPVDYFNPFRNIQIAPSINVEELAKVAHSFGEVVGLGLRNLAHCPVELNLMPKSSLQRQQFAQKKPYFIAAVFCLVAVVFAIGYFYQRVVAIKQDALDKLKTQLAPMLAKEQEMNKVKSDLDKLKKETEKTVALVDDRFYWSEVLMEFRRILVQAEEKTKQKQNTDVGIWIESFAPLVPASSGGGFTPAAAPAGATADGLPPEYARYFGKGSPEPGGVPSAPASAPAGGENDIAVINLICKGVDLDRLSPTANNDLVFNLKAEMAGSQMFTNDTSYPMFEPLKKDQDTLTFTVNVAVKLKRPLKLKYAMD